MRKMREFLYFIKIIFWILGNDIVDLSRATGRAVKSGTIKFGKFMAPRCKKAAKKTKAFLILCKNYTITPKGDESKNKSIFASYKIQHYKSNTI